MRKIIYFVISLVAISAAVCCYAGGTVVQRLKFTNAFPASDKAPRDAELSCVRTNPSTPKDGYDSLGVLKETDSLRTRLVIGGKKTMCTYTNWFYLTIDSLEVQDKTIKRKKTIDGIEAGDTIRTEKHYFIIGRSATWNNGYCTLDNKPIDYRLNIKKDYSRKEITKEFFDWLHSHDLKWKVYNSKLADNLSFSINVNGPDRNFSLTTDDGRKIKVFVGSTSVMTLTIAGKNGKAESYKFEKGKAELVDRKGWEQAFTLGDDDGGRYFGLNDKGEMAYCSKDDAVIWKVKTDVKKMGECLKLARKREILKDGTASLFDFLFMF